jgi:DNA invertase Pin-like site-specific DNA recombinase
MSEKHSTTVRAEEAAVALYRISDDRQESIPTQRAWAQRVAQTDHLILAGEFEDEGISGSDVNRPGLDDLIAFVQQRFYDRQPVHYMLTIDLNRFTRRNSISTGAWLDQLYRHGLRWIITTSRRYDLHNPLDRVLISLECDFTHEPELRSKSNNVLNGMAERARRGLWMGGPIPFAYRLGADGHLVPGPEEEIEILRWIFASYASGRLTANGIVRALRRRGIKPRWAKGGTWSRYTVLKMLAKRTYLGCTIWGEQRVGKYHQLQNGMVVPREDKEDREQQQLLRGLKHLPVSLADEDDCIICPNAHPALIDQETFDACQRRRAMNRDNLSATRSRRGAVWPLAGQLKCGHCGQPLWTIPGPAAKNRGKDSTRQRARVCCCEHKKDPSACTRSAAAPYLDVVNRVIALLREQLATPAAQAEMEAELKRQLEEHDRTDRLERPRLERQAVALDSKISEAVANLPHIAEDLRSDVSEYIRKLKRDRDALGHQLRDLDARQREAAPLDPGAFQETLEMVRNLSAEMDSEEEAELLRATLRDLVSEVRLFFRKRRPSDPRPRYGKPPARVIGRIEVDLTPYFADLLPMGSRKRLVYSTSLWAAWRTSRVASFCTKATTRSFLRSSGRSLLGNGVSLLVFSRYSCKFLRSSSTSTVKVLRNVSPLATFSPLAPPAKARTT